MPISLESCREHLLITFKVLKALVHVKIPFLFLNASYVKEKALLKP